GKYDVYVGGDPQGTRLNLLYAESVRLDDICDTLRPLLEAFARERRGAEAFGDWCNQLGVTRLRDRFTGEPAARARTRRTSSRCRGRAAGVSCWRARARLWTWCPWRWRP